MLTFFFHAGAGNLEHSLARPVFKSEQTTALTFVNGAPLGLKMNTRASPGGVPRRAFRCHRWIQSGGLCLIFAQCNYSQQRRPDGGL
jgi:hypothetical protein